jgi:hypothetical protein
VHLQDECRFQMLHAFDENRLDDAAALLTEGFPNRGLSFWRRGLERLHQGVGNREAGVPLGQMLYKDGQAVGVTLTPASVRRQAQGGVSRIINLSSMYIRAEHSWQAALMFRRLLADKNAVFTDLTPIHAVRPMLTMFGMKAVNHGVQIDLLARYALSRGVKGQLRQWRCDDPPAPTGPSAALLNDHLAFGALPLYWETAEQRQLIVLQPTRIRRVPAMRLVYAESLSHFRQAMPALARLLMSRGHFLLESDCRTEAAAAGAWFRPREVWFARGDEFTDRLDWLGSERFVFHPG